MFMSIIHDVDECKELSKFVQSSNLQKYFIFSTKIDKRKYFN